MMAIELIECGLTIEEAAEGDATGGTEARWRSNFSCAQAGL